MTNLDDLVTVQGAADELGVGADTIRRWIKAGRLPAYRFPGGRGAYLVNRHALDELRVVRPTPPPVGWGVSVRVLDSSADDVSAWLQITVGGQELVATLAEGFKLRDELAAAVRSAHSLLGADAPAIVSIPLFPDDDGSAS